jgi:hypothetical protein
MAFVLCFVSNFSDCFSFRLVCSPTLHTCHSHVSEEISLLCLERRSTNSESYRLEKPLMSANKFGNYPKLLQRNEALLERINLPSKCLLLLCGPMKCKNYVK